MQRFPISNIYSKLTTGFIRIANVAWRAITVLAVVGYLAEGVEAAAQWARVTALAGPALLVYWAVRVRNATCDDGKVR